MKKVDGVVTLIVRDEKGPSPVSVETVTELTKRLLESNEECFQDLRVLFVERGLELSKLCLVWKVPLSHISEVFLLVTHDLKLYSFDWMRGQIIDRKECTEDPEM